MKNLASHSRNFVALSLLGLLSTTMLLAQDKFPQTTDDGLERMEAKKVDVLYWREGATLSDYHRIALLDAYVSFRKNWDRDQNRNRPSISNRVTDKDMERIKKDLAEEFRKVFTKELAEKGGYELTDEAASDVLVLRPAIINLDVTAPDLNSASRVENYITSAGQMTLYLELYDAATGDIIARVIDVRNDQDFARAQRANGVTNRAAADRILRSWADALREALDDAHAMEN
jgi:hypothetical protein